MTICYSVRLDDKINAGLQSLSVQLERSKNFLINKAIQRYVEEELEDEFDIALANESLKIEKESDGEYISWDEAERMAAEIRSV